MLNINCASDSYWLAVDGVPNPVSCWQLPRYSHRQPAEVEVLLPGDRWEQGRKAAALDRPVLMAQTVPPPFRLPPAVAGSFSGS